MKLNRSFGVQLHPTSLPEGRLGSGAYRFVDWLERAGATWWQVLPLHPPDAFGSPYASPSAFACSPALLARPRARVSGAERESFRERHAYWIGEWEAWAGSGAIDDQVRFEREWGALRAHAAERGIRIVGDVPIYVAEDGCDHRSHPELFLPTDLVAGAPPDPLGPSGQKWGNPLYDWSALRRQGYHWWTERFRRLLELVDVVRIDHFRGFVAFWAVPARHGTARRGRFLRGPGAAVFEAAERELGPLPVIAEDLGLITPPVNALREQLGFPGMAVLLWAFGGPRSSPHRLENHREQQVVYTSTHDTATLAEHFPRRDHWELLELAFSSRAALAMVPTQDVLGLGAEGRMNRPGTTAGNWRWRLAPRQLTAGLADRLRASAGAAGRA